MKNLILSLLLISGAASANEAQCLSKILNAEARGESFYGVIALGQAAIKFADSHGASVCKMIGVKRAEVPKEMREYYLALSRQLLATRSTSVSKGADHWNTGARPHLPGKMTRRIDHHVFYVLAPPS